MGKRPLWSVRTNHELILCSVSLYVSLGSVLLTLLCNFQNFVYISPSEDCRCTQYFYNAVRAAGVAVNFINRNRHINFDSKYFLTRKPFECKISNDSNNIE